ncbi:MAG: phasin family protein [Pseudomonadota bacterium]|nr:phasin family protein [Pseudomonadota bacterium]
MEIQVVINDVKGKAETYAVQAQDVFKTSVEVAKQANGIVVGSVQTLAKTESAAAKDLYEAALASFEKAKKAGVKAVANQPVEYLPNGKDRIVTAYSDSVKVVTKARTDLEKVFEKGFDTIQVQLGLKKPAPKKRATAAKKAPAKTAATKKAATGTKTTAKRTTATAKKTTAKATTTSA